MTARVFAVILSTWLAACGPRVISDSELTQLAAVSYDATEMEGKRVVMGIHRGLTVVADFPCSDLCPANTTRIIHYDLPADGTCTSKGVALECTLGHRSGSAICPSSTVFRQSWRRARGVALASVKNGLSNNKMQRTKHGRDGASPLILVLCGQGQEGGADRGE
jgi:hypothetical protein